jgi:HEAT repeat protein
MFVDENKNSNKSIARLNNLINSSVEQFVRLGDQYLLSPILLRIVTITRCLPLRFNYFLQYTEQALLMKRSAGDFEFIHRLLRDYFALRDLQPLLGAADSNRRLEAIRSLGFQGEAAIDALAEFVRNINPDVREAAAWAFGRIASPAVLPHIEVALQDTQPKVRRAAVFSTRNLLKKDIMRLLAIVVNDEDLTVQRALLEVTLSLPDVNSLSSLERLDNGKLVATRMRKNIWLKVGVRQIIFEFVETHPDNQLRTCAIEIARDLKDKKGVPALIAALLDRRFTRRDVAAEALGHIRDPRAVKPLIRALRARNKSLRTAARRALLEINTPEARAAAQKG